MSKHSKQIKFSTLVQDESFIRSVIEAENPKEILEELQKKNPDQSEVILCAFEFIRFSRTEKSKMPPEDFDWILNSIQEHSTKKESFRIFRSIPPLVRIAAMILILLSLGSLVVYRQISKSPLTQFAQSELQENNQAMIVLSDGTTKMLKKNDSLIDYSSSSGNVVVKNIEEEESIGNGQSAKDPIMNQVVVPFGQRHKVLLSDGTLVQLNAGSKLTFPAAFSGNTREVYLKGEGFFEVHKNAKQPFVVKTDYIDIKVLGTTFNISAYDDEHFMTTVLVEGKVNIHQKDKFLANDEFTLSPGQSCIYSVNSKKSIVSDVDVNDYILWKDGLYNFKEMPLADVVSRVNKFFNRNIQIENEKVANTLVSGKLVLAGNITEVLEYLSKTIEGKYEITQDGVFILKQ
jgi:transmembrane sensor